MKKFLPLLILVPLALGTGLYFLYQRYYPGLRYLYPELPAPARLAAPAQIPTATNTTGLPLSLPPGFSISTFAQDLTGARDLIFDSAGHLLVSLPASGSIIALSDTDSNGQADRQVTLLSHLNRPHGLAFSDHQLFVAETHAVSVYDYDPQAPAATRRRQIIDLPSGGGHWTRSLLISNQQLYVSIGSSCNVCHESDSRRASVWIANLDGSDFRPFATGLRNSVFLTLRPATSQIWATDMGRDWLGDHLPPDEINLLFDHTDYGWPFCYGQNVVDSFGNDPQRCRTSQPAHIDLPAHVAPLGLAFIPNSWPDPYRSHLLVAYHGSWNSSIPVGYKIVLLQLDLQGNRVGESDFLTGWLPPQAKTTNSVTGRPVDLLFDSTGHLYISDDHAGVVYRVTAPR